MECASTELLLKATFAVLGWCTWRLHYSNHSVGGILDEAPIILLDSNPLV
jgi:hypothetical protein